MMEPQLSWLDWSLNNHMLPTVLLGMVVHALASEWKGRELCAPGVGLEDGFQGHVAGPIGPGDLRPPTATGSGQVGGRPLFVGH